MAAKLCTKCGKNPKSGDSTDANPWCKACRAEYQREYKQRENWRAERRGIVRGIAAMRESAASFFKGYGARAFMGNEAAAAIEQMAGPVVAPEDSAKE